MIPISREGVYEGVDGLEHARGIPGVVDIEMTAKIGHALEPLPEGCTYLGFIFARGRTPAEVEQSLRTAHAALRFHIAPTLHVVR